MLFVFKKVRDIIREQKQAQRSCSHNPHTEIEQEMNAEVGKQQSLK